MNSSKKIAFLGPEGTVSEESAQYFFQDSLHHELLPFPLISDVFQAAANRQTDYGVIPIENTIEGSVSMHLDMLVHDFDLPIQAEWVYPSVQNLIGRSDEMNGDYSQVTTVLSHPVAIAQCRAFLKQYLPHAKLEHVSSTAEGVRIVSQRPQQGLAALGTQLAASRYQLDILSKGVQDHKNNFTRFILVGHSPLEVIAEQRQKTSILVTLPEDYPGALHQVLSAFAWRRLNLSRIESRPTKKQLGNYFFYIDIESSLETVLLTAAMEEINAIGCQVRVLGCYPSFTFHTTNS